MPSEPSDGIFDALAVYERRRRADVQRGHRAGCMANCRLSCRVGCRVGFSPPIPPFPPIPPTPPIVILAQAGIQTCRHRNLSDKTVSLDFTS
ncbi:TPA: hypothetical protein ACFNMV_001626 [Neisseria lactamica]